LSDSLDDGSRGATTIGFSATALPIRKGDSIAAEAVDITRRCFPSFSFVDGPTFSLELDRPFSFCDDDTVDD
jgi:hypothetical protein